jgi:hypothetical protein
MTRTAASLGALVVAGLLGADPGSSAAKKELSLAALQNEVESLKPAGHVWREIQWKTCPLEALKESRDKKKPVIAWVFLGIPTDERC